MTKTATPTSYRHSKCWLHARGILTQIKIITATLRFKFFFVCCKSFEFLCCASKIKRREKRNNSTSDFEFYRFQLVLLLHTTNSDNDRCFNILFFRDSWHPLISSILQQCALPSIEHSTFLDAMESPWMLLKLMTNHKTILKWHFWNKNNQWNWRTWHDINQVIGYRSFYLVFKRMLSLFGTFESILPQICLSTSFYWVVKLV